MMLTIPYPLDVKRAWLAALTPPERITPADFAEREIVLPASANAEPGKLKLSAMQRGIVDAFTEPDTRIMAMMLAAQTGKSTCINTIIAHTIAIEPAPTLLVQPTEAHALAFMRERLNPMISASKTLRDKIGDGTAGGAGDSNTFKSFEGGFLATASSYRTEDLAARAIKILLADEIDRWSPGGPEGSPLLLALKRQHTFRDRKALLASTPTKPHSSQIAAWYERGDKRKFFCPCPQCDEFEPLEWSQVKWPEEKPNEAYYECLHCGYPMTEADRQRTIELGEWRPTDDTAEPGIVSFHANALCSRFTSLAQLAQEFVAADTPDKLRVFFQTSLALPHSGDDNIEIDTNELMSKSEPLPEPLPNDIAFITCAVDVQADRVEVQWMAHAKAGVGYILHHEKVMFDTSGAAGWALLDQALGRVFTMQDKRVLVPEMTGIDSGFNTTLVAQFVVSQQRKRRRCIALKGVGGWGRQYITRGAKTKGITQIYLIGVDEVRLSVVKRLAMPTPTAPGGLHIANHLPLEFFEGLTAERLTTKYKRGYAKTEWSKDAHARNESLDCAVYNVAIARLIGQPSAQQAQPQKSMAELGRQLNSRNAAQ